jgi:hypothetical protein
MTERDKLNACLIKLTDDIGKPENILKAERALLEAELGVIRAKESLAQEKILMENASLFEHRQKSSKMWDEKLPNKRYKNRAVDTLFLSKIVGFYANDWSLYAKCCRNLFFFVFSYAVSFLHITLFPTECVNMMWYLWLGMSYDISLCINVEIFTFVFFLLTLSHYLFGQWAWDRLIYRKYRLVAIPLFEYKDSNDVRPGFDRATRRASKKVRAYQVVVEYKNKDDIRYMWKEQHFKCHFGITYHVLTGFLVGLKTTRFWNVDHQKLIKLHVSEAMLSMALNRKTIMAPTTELAIERVQRMMMDDNTAQEDYERFLRTGRSVYKDTALVAGWILAGSASVQTFS